MSEGKFQKGQIMCLESGYYSDRGIVGHVRFLRDVSFTEWNEFRQRHLAEEQYQADDDVNAYALLADLTRAGVVEDIHVIEHHADDEVFTRNT